MYNLIHRKRLYTVSGFPALLNLALAQAHQLSMAEGIDCLSTSETNDSMGE